MNIGGESNNSFAQPHKVAQIDFNNNFLSYFNNTL